jgi:septal ring factor EnvC (AmiA/AmiB activator)
MEASERVRAMQLDNQRIATEQAAQALAQEKRLTAEQSDALDRLQRAETAVNEMTKQLLDLNQRRADTQSRIDARAAALGRLLPVILRLSSHPVETLLASPLPAEDSIRGMLVLRGIAREAEADARALIEDREALDAATKSVAEVASGLVAAKAGRSREADDLARQLAETKQRREAAEKSAADAARRAAAEAARAMSLRSMLEILETQRELEEARAREDLLRAERDQKEGAADAARLRQAALSRPSGVGALASGAKAAGQFTAPVSGSVVRGWGDTEEGESATGQFWRTAPGARVVAPCGGVVAFAEPFRGYGLLAIIDCGGGYRAVLAGLDQLAVVPGWVVQEGDQIGTMQKTATGSTPGVSSGLARGEAPEAARGEAPEAARGEAPEAARGEAPEAARGEAPGMAPAESRTAAGGDVISAAASPILYFELRKGSHPIDPAPWLKP